MEKGTRENIYPLTTYLNQNIVFDLLAVIEDGFSKVTNLNVSNSDNKVEVEKGFELYEIKSNLLQQKNMSEEKVHTPTSLLAKLISYLENNELVNEIKKENRTLKI